MTEDKVLCRLPDIELSAAVGNDELVMVDPRGWRWADSGNWHWSRGLGWVPPLRPLLREAGPYLPDIWQEGD